MSDITTQNETTIAKKLQGFAAMTLEQRKAISAKGGRAAHAKGTGHRFTVEEARVAGAKGGAASRVSRANKRLQRSQQKASDHIDSLLLKSQTGFGKDGL